MANTNNKPDKSFGQRLQDFRLERHWTLAKLAEFTDMDKGHLSRIENGLITPSKLTVKKLTDAIPQLSEVA